MIFVFTPNHAWAERTMYERGYEPREWRFVQRHKDVTGYSGEGHSVITEGQLSLEQHSAKNYLASKGIA